MLEVLTIVLIVMALISLLAAIFTADEKVPEVTCGFLLAAFNFVVAIGLLHTIGLTWTLIGTAVVSVISIPVLYVSNIVLSHKEHAVNGEPTVDFNIVSLLLTTFCGLILGLNFTAVSLLAAYVITRICRLIRVSDHIGNFNKAVTNYLAGLVKNGESDA